MKCPTCNEPMAQGMCLHLTSESKRKHRDAELTLASPPRLADVNREAAA